jgi:(E)-4-hydroxy-3-methyl-but-2-enyl pyrophosphate reductase
VEVILSKSLGFCSGVGHVIGLAQECFRIAAEKQLPVYSIGWFIHNQRVVDSFIAKGMRHIEHPEDGLPGVALIRAHGIPDTLRKSFFDAGYFLVDGTCHNVGYSQNIIRNIQVGTTIVIAGIVGHSEVVALSGLCDSAGSLVPVSVVESAQDVTLLPDRLGEYVLMTQTTLPAIQYKEIFNAMRERFGTRLTIGNHLCPGALRRNKALIELCAGVEAVVVVGGLKSANTTALAKIVTEQGLPVWHIESAQAVIPEMRIFKRIGLTAGTSTPKDDIDDVYRALKGETT